jgi:hypothetical protein
MKTSDHAFAALRSLLDITVTPFDAHGVVRSLGLRGRDRAGDRVRLTAAHDFNDEQRAALEWIMGPLLRPAHDMQDTAREALADMPERAA